MTDRPFPTPVRRPRPARLHAVLALPLALALALALAAAPRPAAAKIVQVQVIHRHGARPPLTKHPFDPSRETRAASQPALYAEGARQLRALGAFVRAEYFAADPLSVTDVQSYSSNLPRTLLSARAFLAGLFGSDGDASGVATMVYNASATDWRLRGYALCPALGAKFEAFTRSAAYKRRKREDEPFVREITRNLPKSSSSSSATTTFDFDHVFNVYDRFALVRDGYTDSPDGDGQWPALGDADFARLKKLADWFESHKFNFATHGLPVAGGLLRSIVERARAFESRDASAVAQRVRLVEYSAHYPTILTLLAAMRRDSDEPDDPADKIPAFGEALLVELHDDDDEGGGGGGALSMRLRWAARSGEAYAARAVSLEHAGCKDADKGCAMSGVERAWALGTLGLSRFCEHCGSEIAVCYGVRGGGGGPSSSSSGVGDAVDEAGVAAGAAAARCGNGRVAVGFVGAVIGLVGGVGGALAYMSWSSRRKAAALAWGGSGESFEGDIRA